jgi:hypothetical protein
LLWALPSTCRPAPSEQPLDGRPVVCSTGFRFFRRSAHARASPPQGWGSTRQRRSRTRCATRPRAPAASSTLSSRAGTPIVAAGRSASRSGRVATTAARPIKASRRTRSASSPSCRTTSRSRRPRPRAAPRRTTSGRRAAGRWKACCATQSRVPTRDSSKPTVAGSTSSSSPRAATTKARSGGRGRGRGQETVRGHRRNVGHPRRVRAHDRGIEDSRVRQQQRRHL